jgi:multidrug resistance efflux pump
MVKLILTGTVLTIAIVGLSVAIDAQSRTPRERPVPDAGRRLICASGRIEGATPEIKLRPQLAGRVVKICVKEGQFVQAGEPLLELDDAQYALEVAVAEAELHLAEAQLQRLVHGAHGKQRAEAAALYRAKQAELERARLTWQRIEGLRSTQAVTGQEADNSRTLVAGLRAEVEAAEAHLQWLDCPARPDEVQIETARVEEARARWKLAKVQLERTRVRSPLKGQVLKTNIEAGELAGPDSPEPAIIVADTTHCRVRAFVEEMDARDVRVGMAARITAEGPRGQELRGHIVRLSPRMENKNLWNDHPAERLDTKTREIWIDLDDSPSVVGLRVDVEIDPSS